MQSIVATILALAMSLGSFAAALTGDQKTADLLKQARAALGGDKLDKVQGLSATGTYQRQIGDRNLKGELSIDLQLPDKMLRTETMNPMGDATITMEMGFNGDKVLRHSTTTGGGPNMMIRINPPGGADAEAQALRNARADFARLVIAFLLTSPQAMPVEFAYGGQAESPDGKADVLDAKGAGSFAAKVLIDPASHRPLMMVYQGIAPRIVMSTQTAPPGAHPDPEQVKKAADAAAAAQPAPQLVDISMFLDDYRQVDGVWLPHHVSRSIDGKPNEEWTFTTIRLNPSFKPDTFSVK